MNLILIENDTAYSSGYGAGDGEIVTEVYKCPCEKGKVTYQKDDTSGFRSTDIFCDCKECTEKYEFGRGRAIEKDIY
ncbi:hypothetical protein CN630_19995 [Bacillus wiedmannii]|uniref:hypothetical protein n=1 Tax=Bacillus wiedmannii TaxID=1890302 RepID=UPI000BF843BE|nr:hypothetical protein [Bacillus wiedmannii]PEN45060.1 hypothetical protein CN630_19995 [Bacillus wiedmannii]